MTGKLTLWGLHEIAEHYAISRQLAQKWATHSAFPAPVADLRMGRVWNAAEVTAWAPRPADGKAPGPVASRRCDCGPATPTASYPMVDGSHSASAKRSKPPRDP